MDAWVATPRRRGPARWCALLLAMSTAVIVAACGKGPGAATPAEPNITADTVRFALDAPAVRRLTTTQVAAAQRIVIQLPARLAWDEDHTSRITAPLAGRVTQVLVAPGDSVTVNQPLAYLVSAELGSAQSDAARAAADLTQATRTAARTKELADAGIVAGKDLEQTQGDLARAGAEARRTSLRLQALGAGNVVDQRFALRSPIAGVVVERNLNVGMEWRPDQPTAPLLVVSDPAFLWCWIDVPERSAGILRPGQTVIVRASALPDETFEATVDHVADALDPVSRTLKIRAHLRNPERRLKAEMYVTAEVVRQTDGALDVPASAVYLHDGAQRVFVRTAPAQFTRRTVTGIPSGDERVTIVAGDLKKGDEVVTDGVLYLEQVLDDANRPAK
jgi:membrane fusion protein, heavy metal efflux system